MPSDAPEVWRIAKFHSYERVIARGIHTARAGRHYGCRNRDGRQVLVLNPLAFEPASNRRMAADRWPLHDDETSALKVAHDTLGGDATP
jgi:hypothetical protein